MPHETEYPTIKTPIAVLNRQMKNIDPVKVLELAIATAVAGRVALVSSFGVESIVLLHMVSRINPDLPILFIDTQMLFAETLIYQREVARKLGLSDVRRIGPDATDIFQHDPYRTLNNSDMNACCDLRKTRPLQHALNGFDAWITGRKRYQSGVRAQLEHFERDNDGRIKVNPLAHWQPSDLGNYVDIHRLPRHPMSRRGFKSVGCSPCTSSVNPGEDTRAGRWRGHSKTECGIHLPRGKPTGEILAGDALT